MWLFKRINMDTNEEEAPVKRSYVQRLVYVFGWKLLLYIGFAQFLLKGIAHNISLTVALPIFKNTLGADAATLQLQMMIAMLPWSLKPLMGLLADLCVVGGYHKRYWLLQGLLLGTLGAAGLFLSYAAHSMVGATLCLMGIQMQVALFDLMTEGTYSAEMRDNPSTGSDVVTLTTGMQSLGAICSSLFVGLLTNYSIYYPIFAVLLALCVAPALPTLLGWLGEVREDGRCCTYTKPRDGHCAQIGVIAFAGIAAPVTVIISNFVDPAYGLAVAALASMSVLMLAFFAFPGVVARLALYQVISIVSRPSLGRALEYFYTADETCVVNGPHFDYAYYISVAGIVGSAASLAGSLLYQIVFARMRYRPVLLVTTLLRAAAGLSDLWILKRWNLAWGIPDAWAYLAGEAIVEPVVSMLNYVPGSVLISKVVERGMEASTYAFMAGTYNFAVLTSSLSGELLFEGAGVRTLPPSCDFSPLGWLIPVCHVASPLVCSLGALWLIPDAYQTDALPSSDGGEMPVEQTLEIEMEEF